MTRSEGCPTVEPLLTSYAAPALDEASEKRVRDHLAGCASCRDRLAEIDPSAIFLGLRREPLPEGFLDGLAGEVRRRVEQRRRPAFLDAIAFGFSGRRWAAIAAPVTTLLLLGTLFLVRPGFIPRGPHPSPYVTPPGSAPVSKEGTLPPGSLVIPAVPLEAGASALPLMEAVGSPGARIYTFTVGEGSDATPIYFVVDESIDIR